MGKTAIFGGTFDPVHNGHIQMLQSILTLENLEKVLVIPNYCPPHKTGTKTTSADRLNMCKLAFENPLVQISDIEINRRGKSYTLDTLKQLKTEGIDHPYLVIGGDSLVDFEKWYCYSEILKLCTLAVFDRSEVSAKKFNAAINRLKVQGADILPLNVCPAPVCSTEIRALIKSGQPYDHLVPPKVLEYIKSHKLYLE